MNRWGKPIKNRKRFNQKYFLNEAVGAQPQLEFIGWNIAPPDQVELGWRLDGAEIQMVQAGTVNVEYVADDLADKSEGAYDPAVMLAAVEAQREFMKDVDLMNKQMSDAVNRMSEDTGTKQRKTAQ